MREAPAFDLDVAVIGCLAEEEGLMVLFFVLLWFALLVGFILGTAWASRSK